MKRTETAEETRRFDSTLGRETAPIGFLLAGLSGAVVGACLTLLFLMPLLVK